MANGDDKWLEEGELVNDLDSKARQLRALLVNTFASSGEGFRAMSDELQENYMWACADLATDMIERLEKLAGLHSARSDTLEVQHG
jgi:hypothetical protein